MSSRPLVTIVGATGAQGGAVVRSLLETGKYKVLKLYHRNVSVYFFHSKLRGLTRDPTSEKAQALRQLSNDIEVVKCDVSKSDDVQRAFKDSWAVFALTDYWAQPDKPEAETQQGIIMADAAALLKIPYYIFSTAEDVNKLSNGKLSVKIIFIKN
jgi:uncharacterized protein YbjT (DUF2867 family)